MVCWKCKQEKWVSRQYKTLNQPLMSDIICRYCADCMAIHPDDAAKCKRKYEAQQRSKARGQYAR